jgi:peroxidase
MKRSRGSVVVLFAITMAIMTVFMVAAGRVLAQDGGGGGQRGPNEFDRNDDGSGPIPLTGRRGGRTRPPEPGPGGPGGPGGGLVIDFPEEFRTIDGTDNNQGNAEWGASEIMQLRLTSIDYADGTDAPSGANRASARAVSNAVAAQVGSIVSDRGASDYLWQWGQFVDHDIDETPAADPAEAFNIAVPAGDPDFDPQGTGTVEIGMSRSDYEHEDGVRQQLNVITSYIDASNVYGSDETRAFALRTLDGTGRLKTSEGNLLPFNEPGLANAGGPSATLFLAGDVRANEQVGLTAMHTLFVREHNYWADTIRGASPNLTGEETYQLARMIVAAEMQSITVNEFLPVFLGPDALGPYRGYDPRVNAGIANVFSTAAYRVGHTMLSPQILRLDASGEEAAEGHLPLLNAFFSPSEISDNGIDSMLRGLAGQTCQEIDNKVVDDIRNFLFGPPGAGGFDLASLNIQRGRDHGLPGYNGVRRDFGLRPVRNFQGINLDAGVAQAMASVYASVDDVDPWVGLLAEPHVPGAMVGETLRVILADQFRRLRDGDRFWYESSLSPEMVEMIEEQTLAVIIRRNTEIGEELSDDVFVAEEDDRDGGDRPRRR